MLTRADILGPVAPPRVAGLIVIDQQSPADANLIAPLLELPTIAPIDIEPDELLAGGAVARRQIEEATFAVAYALQQGFTALVYTNRSVPGLSAHLARIVVGLDRRPGFVISLGGDTPTDLARIGFGAHERIPIGSALGGSVEHLPAESRFPHLAYITPADAKLEPEAFTAFIRMLRGDD